MTQRKRIRDPLARLGDAISRVYRSVFAGSVTVAPIMPVAAALATAGIYITRKSPWNTEWIILTALATTVAAWLVGAVLSSGRTGVTTSNPRVYLNLVSLTGQLEASLKRLQDEFATDDSRSRAVSRLEHELAVIRRILSVQSSSEPLGVDQDAVKAQAEPFIKRRDWPLGTAYNELYRRLHAVEAELLLICGHGELLACAIEDHFRLRGSNVGQRESWLYQLEVAVAAFGEDPRTFFERPGVVLPSQAQPPTGPPQVAPLASPPGSTPALLSPEAERDARFKLRCVRAAVNDYRDGLFEGIVRQRLRTMWTVFATGAGLYLLVVLAALHPTNREHMFGATVLFLIGALVGLFNRLAQLSDQTSAVEDYGLSTVRLLQTVVLSGVAAVLGVVVMAYGVTAAANSDMLPGAAATPTVTASGTPPLPSTPVPTSTPAPAVSASPGAGRRVEPPDLGRLFELEAYPFAILLAAIFGLTPQLVLRRLEATADQLKLDIQSVGK